jgi:putative colanic acid biosynthesis acetyltransferase WcaF
MTLPPLTHEVHSHPRREFLANSVFGRLPSVDHRLRALMFLGLNLEDPDSTFIARRVRFLNLETISIGARTTVNFEVLLDGRGGLSIGRDVAVAPRVTLVTAYHDEDADMADTYQPVAIRDQALLSTGCMILPGVEVGQGGLVAAGAVVSRDVEPWTIVAGVPARTVRSRRPDQRYRLGSFRPSWH